ncbi:hypothetical protein COBT_003363 [Conglomerata obtusa]
MQKPHIPLPAPMIKAIYKCYCHLGGKNVTRKLESYVFGRQPHTNICIIDTHAQWHKLILAARAFCSIENPADVVVVSSKSYGRKAVQRFCEATGATPFTGRFTPGAFTNQQISKIREPQLLLVSDPFTDKQTVEEASYVNIPCIAFCNTDNETRFVDIAIPMNNRSLQAIGAGFCILARLINYIKHGVDLCEGLNFDIERYFFRNVSELEEFAAEHEALKAKEAAMCEAEENCEA